MNIYQPTISGSLTVTGSTTFLGNVTVNSGTLTAQTLVVQTITSSILYTSGSNVFGNALSNTQTFTGSVNITGSSHAIFGNVGIGIASPAEKIHVFGSSAATSPRILIQSHDTANATAGLTLYGRDVSNVNKVSEIVTSGSDLTISVNSLERMRINSSGYVGIGTSNPTGSLDVSGSIYIRSTGGGVLYIPRMADQSRGLSIGEQTALGSKSAVIRTAGGVSEHLFLDPGFNSSDVAGNIALAYANTGSVGIGTYLPSAKLHVVGLTGGASGGATGIPSLGFANSSSIALFTNKDTAYGTLFGTLNTGNGWIQQQRVDGTGTAYNLSLQPNGGNVGIGTSIVYSGAKLHILGGILAVEPTNGNTNSEILVGRGLSSLGTSAGSGITAKVNFAFEGSNDNFYQELGFITTTANQTRINSTADFYISTKAAGSSSPTERLRISGSGQIGIGTSSWHQPYTKLIVAGGIAYNNNADAAVSDNSYGQSFAKKLNIVAGSGANTIYSAAGSEAALYVVTGLNLTASSRFADIVLYLGAGSTAPVVIASQTYAGSVTRTYANSGENLTLSLTGNSNTYTIRMTGMGANERT